jgi:hypothetical protein
LPACRGQVAGTQRQAGEWILKNQTDNVPFVPVGRSDVPTVIGDIRKKFGKSTRSQKSRQGSGTPVTLST